MKNKPENNNLMTNENTPFEEMMKDINFFKRVEEILSQN